MKVKILYFSSIKDKLKKGSEEIELPQGADLSTLINILKEKYPSVAESIQNSMFAVNEEYSTPDTKLNEGDTVAVIPPVSGG
ncbi:MAG: molybdopterin converting factor subunit 1 [Aquificae bacterium]|nr:molybdopterin converting factor subunit 1 [Aquificota bacterium]